MGPVSRRAEEHPRVEHRHGRRRSRDSLDRDSVDIESLADTSIPLLISTGSESPVLEVAAANELARMLPAARLETLDGTGHIPHRTHPDVYVAALIEFIGGVTTASSIAGGVA